ncbi:hypothetical protein BGZ65_010263, partial [Modicella reniformis]
MGIRGLFQYLKKKGVVGEPASPSALDNAYFDVDLLGTFYWFLLDKLAAPGRTVRPVDVGRQMAYFLSETFLPARTLLHIDGKSTTQKGKARTERDAARDKVHAALQANLTKMEKRSNLGKWTSQSVVKQIERALPRIYVLTQQTKQELVRGLKVKFQVCECIAESDTCVAAAIKAGSTKIVENKQYQRVAVSSDSDLLIYPGVENVLRRNPRGQDYSLYKKSSIVTALGLLSAAHLAVLGVVSNNDYGPNVPNYGFFRNSEILKGLSVASTRDVDILDAYKVVIANTRFDTSLFDHAKQVFLRMGGQADLVSVANNAKYVTAAASFSSAKQTRITMRAQRDTDIRFSPSVLCCEGVEAKPVFDQKLHILTSPARPVNLEEVRQQRKVAPPGRAGTKPRRQKAMRKAKKKQKKQARKPSQGGGGEITRSRATNIDHELRRKHVTKTLTVGCIAANVKRALPASSDHKKISDRLSSCVRALNQMRIHAYEIIALDIARILGDRYKPSVPDPKGKAIQTTTEQGSMPAFTGENLSDLDDILDNLNFYYALCTLLCQGRRGAQTAAQRIQTAPPRTMSTRSTAAGTSARETIPISDKDTHPDRAYQAYLRHTNLLPFSQQFPGKMFAATVARLTLATVKHAFRAHYMGSKFSEDDKLPDGRNAIDYFYEQNHKTGMFADFPKSKFRPTYVFLSEEDLVHIFYSDPTTRSIVSNVNVLGQGTDQTAASYVVNNK